MPPAKKGMSTGAIIAIVIGSVVALCCVTGTIGAVLTDKKTATNVTDVPTGGAAPASTTAASAPTTAAAAPTTPAGPKTTITGNGTFLVGVDFVPGTYRTTVPASSPNCYWERLRGLSGQFTDIIANENTEPGGQAVVTIPASDKAFKTTGCGTWQKID